MTDDRRHDDGPPEGWSPETDRDAAWEGIAAMMREADRPVLPTDSRYRQMLATIRRQAGPVSTAPDRRTDTFGGWTRAVLCDGGPAAQILRMAAVAGLVWFGVSRPLQPDASVEVAASAAPARTAPPATSPATLAADEFVDPVPANLIAATTPQAPLAEDLPRAGDGVVMPVVDWREYVSNNVGQSGAIYPVSNSRSLGFGDAGGSSWGGDGSAAADNASLREVVSELQQLRFHSMVNQDEEGLGRIRRFEQLLTPLVEERRALPPDTVQAIDTFQRAEEFLAARRNTDALMAYAEVRQIVPGSFVAFLAQYQIAGISFIHLRDYDAALEAYRKTMDEYPAHFLSDAHKNHIASRIEFLAQNREEGWRAVTLWQDAQIAPPETRVSLLREIVETSPQLPLAADAAMALLDMTVGDPAKPSVMSPRELVELCNDAIESRPESAHAAEIQFVKAEAIFRRLFDLEHADVEFRKALEMPGAEAIADRTQVRLNQIARRN